MTTPKARSDRAPQDARTSVYPCLRDDLTWVEKYERRRPTGEFLLRDPKTGEVWDMSAQERFICLQLDGQTTLEVVKARYEREFGQSISTAELEAFVHQLDFEELFVRTVIDREWVQYWDPEEAFIPNERYSLFDPDRLLTRLYRYTRWMFTPAFVVVSLGIIAFGLSLLVSHWQRLIDDMYAIWVPQYLVLVILVGVGVVQVLHEFSHGLVCKHYGGQVNEGGFMLVYHFIFKFYLRRSHTMLLPQRARYQKCLVPVAGLYCQFLLASIGIIAVVLIVTPGGWAHMFWTALWSTAAWGAFHNLNIAHRRDAHFLMSTYLGIFNMRERCVTLFLNWAWGRPLQDFGERERFWLIVYGSCIPVYYTVHGFVMFYSFGEQVLYYMQSGFGVIAFLLVLAYAFHVPIKQGLHLPARFLLASEAGWARRWVIRLGWIVLAILLLLIPYPYSTGGPFQLLPSTQTEIHCEIDGGRIAKVDVKEGDLVVVGRPLAQIDPHEYEKNVATTQAQIDHDRAQLALLRKQFAMLTNPPNVEQIHALEAEVRRLEALLVEYKKQLELTTLRAPVTGRVTTPLVDQKVGQYLRKGDLFAVMEQAQAVQVEIQVPEGDVSLVKVGAKVKVAPWAFPNETFVGAVTEIAPVAALPTDARVTTRTNSVRVLAELPNKDLRLKSQITGFAKIQTQYMPIWLVLTRVIIRWFQVQFWYWLP